MECGPGATFATSDTFALEQDMGWTGLLVEGSPKNYHQLFFLNRKAWSIQNCMSDDQMAYSARYREWGDASRCVYKDNY